MGTRMRHRACRSCHQATFGIYLLYERIVPITIVIGHWYVKQHTDWRQPGAFCSVHRATNMKRFQLSNSNS